MAEFFQDSNRDRFNKLKVPQLPAKLYVPFNSGRRVGYSKNGGPAPAGTFRNAPDSYQVDMQPWIEAQVLNSAQTITSAWTFSGAVTHTGLTSVGGGFTGGFELRTDNTVTATELVTELDAGSNTIDVTLPAIATANDGQLFYLIITDSTTNDITVDGTGSDTVDGSSQTITDGGEGTYMYVADLANTDWKAIQIA